MSKLRPECGTSFVKALSDETALFLIRDAVAKRRVLIYGQLHDKNGHHCALGCFWADNPMAVLHNSLIDEVATVNDSIPSFASPQKRWKKVNSWLRFKLRVLVHAKP